MSIARLVVLGGLLGCGLSVAGGCVAAALPIPSSGLTISAVAGDGKPCLAAPSCGDGGPATSAQLTNPTGIAVDAAGDVYIADTEDNEVREVSPGGTIKRVAGNGTRCFTATSCGDGGPATSAQLNYPDGLAVDAAGDVYIADSQDDEVRMVSPSGTITRFAGNGTGCMTTPNCGDGGPATAAQLNAPWGLAVDAAGDVYIADFGDNEVREVSPSGTITTIAGNGTPCGTAASCGEGGPATAAQLYEPDAVAVDAAGDVYIAGDEDVWEVGPAGTISRIAGNGTPCATAPSCGDGGPATSAQLGEPNGLAVDAAGNVYIADFFASEVRRVSPSGAISTIAGTGTACPPAPVCGAGGQATGAAIDPEDVAVDQAAGALYVVDGAGHVWRLSGPQPSTTPGAPIDVGATGSPDGTVPAIAVDAAGTAYIAWDDPTGPFLHYCKLPAGASACAVSYSSAAAGGLSVASGGVLYPPDVVLSGGDVYVFAYGNTSAAPHEEGLVGWVSADGGDTFTPLLSGDAISDTGPAGYPVPGGAGVVALAGGNLGVAWLAPQPASGADNGGPEFQAVSLTAPAEHSNATAPQPFAYLDPADQIDASNSGGSVASYFGLVANPGLLGVFNSVSDSHCGADVSVDAWTYADGSPTTTALNESPGVAGSDWTPLAVLDCGFGNPAVAGGPAGFGVLDDGKETLAYRRFDEAGHRFDAAPVTVSHESEYSPSLSQDGAGGVYATWINNSSGLRLAYSPDGGRIWHPPVTLNSAPTVNVDQASAVDAAGSGWAAYSDGSSLFAIPFTSAVDPVGPAPEVSAVSQSASKWVEDDLLATISRAGVKLPVGTSFRFNLSKAARVTFTFKQPVAGRMVGRRCVAKTEHNAHQPGCARVVSIATISFAGHAGPDTVRFGGRVSKQRKLKPGAYALAITATASAHTSTPHTLRFTIAAPT